VDDISVALVDGDAEEAEAAGIFNAGIAGIAGLKTNDTGRRAARGMERAR
jgi:hypothetical protein